jgi:hypothetical protein
MMPSKVCGMFPVRPPINVLRAMTSLRRRSFGANMTFSWTDPFPVGICLAIPAKPLIIPPTMNKASISGVLAFA